MALRFLEVVLTLRWEAGVKLTPDPINFLMFKNGFNLYRQDFVTFNIFFTAFNLALLVYVYADRGRSY